MRYDRLWERLIEYLNEWSRAREVPGGIEVTTVEQLTGATRTIQIVLTPDGWDDYASTIYGGGDPSATAIQESVLAMPDDRPFLVYDTYDWVPSTTPTLPVDTFRPEPGGEWVAFDRDGNVTSRFADWVEPELGAAPVLCRIALAPAGERATGPRRDPAPPLESGST